MCFVGKLTLLVPVTEKEGNNAGRVHYPRTVTDGIKIRLLALLDPRTVQLGKHDQRINKEIKEICYKSKYVLKGELSYRFLK